MSKEIEILTSGILTGKLPEVLFKINISEKDRLRIDDIRARLTIHPDLSYIVYFNHISFNDPVFAAYIIQKIDPNHSRHLIAPASFHHTEPNNPKNKKFIFMIEIAKKTGFEIKNLIQAYQVGNPEYGYTEDQAQVTYRVWLRRLKELRSSNIAMGCLISPEGTRSDDGVLGVGEPGIIATGSFMVPVMYIPLGISYIDGYNREKFNLGKRLNLSLGEIIIQNNSGDQPNMNDLMTNLSLTLPEYMRGQW